MDTPGGGHPHGMGMEEIEGLGRDLRPPVLGNDCWL